MKENQIALRAGFLEKEVFNSYFETNIIKRISIKLINCSGLSKGGPPIGEIKNEIGYLK